MTFSQDELIRALQEAKTDSPNATPNSITSSELARALECSQDQARELIRDAIEAGVVRPERVWRTLMTGPQRIAGYVLVETG